MADAQSFVPPCAEQTTMNVDIGGVMKNVTIVYDINGDFLKSGNGYTYEASDGERFTLAFKQASEPSGSGTPPAPACPPQKETCSTGGQSEGTCDDDSGAAAVPPKQWSTQMTRFFIEKYKDMKDLVGTRGGFRTKQMLWRKLAELVNEEFGDTLTAKQTENKWKSLERGYKNATKNNKSTGRANLTCDFEKELSGVLDKEHHIRPQITLAPGRTMFADSDANNASDEAGPSSPGEPHEEPHQESALPQVASTRAGRKRRSQGNASVIEALNRLAAGMADRHREKMARIIALMERQKE
ncbi:uncharacterized protein LOC144175179 [Haemaphysalis longicornis]